MGVPDDRRRWPGRSGGGGRSRLLWRLGRQHLRRKRVDRNEAVDGESHRDKRPHRLGTGGGRHDAVRPGRRLDGRIGNGERQGEVDGRDRRGGARNASSPLVSSNTVYFSGWDGTANTLYSVNETSGAINWTRELSTNELWGTPALSSADVYLGDYSGTMYGSSAATARSTGTRRRRPSASRTRGSQRLGLSDDRSGHLEPVRDDGAQTGQPPSTA